MEFWILLGGLALTLVGAILVALADAWLSRLILVYLDAIEHDVMRVVVALRAGSIDDLNVSGIDVKRDRGQNVARALKTLGWLALAVGFALQIVAVCLTKRMA